MTQDRKDRLLKKHAAAGLEGKELLLEIGAEELPYQFVPMAIAELREAAERLLKEHRLTHGPLRTFGTPRRLVLVVESVANRQTGVVKEVMGPSKTVAFDSGGE